MVRPKTILVTGCAGFIGSNFVNRFRKKYPATKVVGIDDLSNGRKDAVNPETIFYKGSILDGKLVDRIFEKHRPEYVFHFAALPRVSFSHKFPRLSSEVNIIGTVTLLEMANQYDVKRVIFSSSSSVYGGAKKMPTKESENRPAPKSLYAVQKYSNEKFCKAFSKLFGLDTVCLRYFLAFGPGQHGDSPYSTVISAWLESLYFPKNKKAFIEGDGTQSRDFCYVDNIVMANIQAMEADKDFGGEVINIANGEQTTLNQVRALIEEYTGKKLKLEHRPVRLGDVRHTHADISRAKRLLGYNPKIKFEDGLKRTIKWFESRTS
ncbi:MAG TPA: NAD-dependent epimerase/dehydratase family protein [Patescibacteria group bacterium]|nr:NAD-dependent epimerase/dehydratase family protein [Patescibacteria group bacterium]